MKTFQAEILTPQKTVFSGQAEALVLKGALGYFGILAGHAPLIARLTPGKLKLTRDGHESVFQAGPGFVQVSPPAPANICEVVAGALPARRTLSSEVGGRAGKEHVSILLDEIK